MRAYRLILFLALLYSTSLYAQVGWIEHPLATGYDGAWGIYAIDMDGDTDIDIVSTGYGNYEITWWENDGTQNFTEHTIDAYLYGAIQVQAGDLDGDGDVDVLAVAVLGNQIVWYENDGQMNFTKYTLVQNFAHPLFAQMYDIDDDDDMDIVSCCHASGRITWWENTGYPNFTRHDIDSTFDGARHVNASDLDNDGDIDILASAEYIRQVAWYENDGNEVFYKHVIVDNYYSFWAKPYDFGGDNDWDILSCDAGGNEITWWENNGSMNFTRHVVDANFGDPQAVEAADFDLDGDLDIVAASRTANQIAWWENEGNTTFTKHVIKNGFGYAVTVFPVDIELDGDVDVIGAAWTGDMLSWWENNHIFTPAVVVGTVTNEWGIPMDGVYVHDADTFDTDHTNIYGEYDLDLYSGHFDITFSKPGYHDSTVYDVIAFQGDTTVLDMTLYGILLPCASCVRGIVENMVPSLVESVYVHATGTSVDDYTDFLGRYSLEDLAPGYYDISFEDVSYLDTVVTGVFVTNDSATTLNMALEGNGAITGFVADSASQPVVDVTVNVLDTDLSAITDSSGGFFIEELIPGYIYDVLFVRYDYLGQVVHDVSLAVNETLVLDTVYLQPITSEVAVWYGNVDLSPITAPIGATILVDVYVQTAPNLNFNFFHLPLGTNDQYIVDNHSSDEGILYYPLTEWDDVSFYQPTVLSPGWHNQTLLAFADIMGPPNPYLVCLEPTRIASYALEVANDSSLIGSTEDCFIEGYDPANGGPLFGDSTGVIPYYPYQFFSPLHFTEPVAAELSVWYGNPDSLLIPVVIGDTVLIDVYVQSSIPINLDSLHLPLATDDQYIAGNLGETEGILYYPLTEWDDVDFLPPNEPTSGWHSQSLLGIADTGGDPNPYLLCSVPTKIASFAVEIVNDSSIIGDTAECFMEGSHPVYGGPVFRDTTGVRTYYPDQVFASLYFVEPGSGGCEYVTGDANNSGDYNGLDITFGVSYFKGGPVPPYECECTPGRTWYVSGDVNSTCDYNGIDITYGVAFLKGGPAPTPCGDCPPPGITGTGYRNPGKARKLFFPSR